MAQDSDCSTLNEITMGISCLNVTDTKQGKEISSSRTEDEEIIIAGGLGLKSVETYNPTKEVWSPLAEMAECRSGATSFIHNNHMVVTGGFFDNRVKNSVEELNVTQKDGTWCQSAIKLCNERVGHKTVLYQDRLIVTGGRDNRIQCCNTIHEILLVQPYSSKLLTQMPSVRSFHGTELIDGKVYIVGGREGSHKITNSVVMYDPVTNICKEMAPLPYGVAIMATVAWQDNVVVIGGMNQDGNRLDTVVMYNVKTEKHTVLPKMKQKRLGCTAVTMGNNIVVMGGQSDICTILNSVECYSFDTNEWQDLSPMIEPRQYATAVVKHVMNY